VNNTSLDFSRSPPPQSSERKNIYVGRYSEKKSSNSKKQRKKQHNRGRKDQLNSYSAGEGGGAIQMANISTIADYLLARPSKGVH